MLFLQNEIPRSDPHQNPGCNIITAVYVLTFKLLDGTHRSENKGKKFLRGWVWSHREGVDGAGISSNPSAAGNPPYSLTQQN
jgi:hypothetical protein